MIRPLLKKTSLEPLDFSNYRPVLNLLFLGKVSPLCRPHNFLDDTDYLDPFQSRFRLGLGMEAALVALGGDLRWDLNKGSTSLLSLLGLSVAFDTMYYCILQELGLGGPSLRWFCPFLSNKTQKGRLGLLLPMATGIWDSTATTILSHWVRSSGEVSSICR